MKTKYIILMLAAACMLFISTTIYYREKSFLRQRMLDNEFQLGIYSALLTMRDEKMLCPGKFNFFELRDLSIEKQDSLRTILPEGIR